MFGWGEGCFGGYGDVEVLIDGCVIFYIFSCVRLGIGWDVIWMYDGIV